MRALALLGSNVGLKRAVEEHRHELLAQAQEPIDRGKFELHLLAKAQRPPHYVWLTD